MGAEKSQRLLSASQGLRKAGVQFSWGTAHGQAEGVDSTLSTPCPSRALSQAGGAHSHWGGPSTLPSPPVPVLLSLGDTLTSTQDNIQSGHHVVSQVTYEINRLSDVLKSALLVCEVMSVNISDGFMLT